MLRVGTNEYKAVFEDYLESCIFIYFLKLINYNKLIHKLIAIDETKYKLFHSMS